MKTVLMSLTVLLMASTSMANTTEDGLKAMNADDSSGIAQIREDQRLDNTSCLQTLSVIDCRASGHVKPGSHHVNGSCQMKAVFRLGSGESVTHELKGSASKQGEDASYGGFSGLADNILTLGFLYRDLAKQISSEVLEQALFDFETNEKTFSEDLKLKKVGKCEDFRASTPWVRYSYSIN